MNVTLTEVFKQCGMRLVNFKLEYGRLQDNPAAIALADEISPDGFRPPHVVVVPGPIRATRFG